MTPEIYVILRSGEKVEFLDIGRMFKYIDENLDNVVNGWVGV